MRVIPALCGCYASLFCWYSAAILLLFCCYSGFILALFFYAVLYAALYSVLYARQQTTTTSTAATTSSSNKTQMTPNSDSATKETWTDKQTGKGPVVLDHQPARPLSSCVFSAEAEEQVGRLNIPGPSDRRTSPRARPPRARHSIDGQSPFTPPATPAPMPGSAALVRDRHVVARTRSSPLASLDLTAISISRRRCRVEIHAPAPSQGGTSN